MTSTLKQRRKGHRSGWAPCRQKALSLAAWKGGKARLASRLLLLFPPHRCYVEPFGGMASVLLNKQRAQTEVYNDRDSRLVTLFSVLKYHPDSLNRELCALLKSRRTFELYRAQTGLTDIQRAARFLYCQSLGFGGMGKHFGTSVKSGGGSLRSVHLLRAVCDQIHVRLRNVIVECLDWEQCIDKYDDPDTFFYCDPPYWGTEGYDVAFSERDQRALADRLCRIRGKFLMTNSDTREVRQLYRGFTSMVLKGQLSIPRAHTGVLRHLIAMNYEPPK